MYSSRGADVGDTTVGKQLVDWMHQAMGGRGKNANRKPAKKELKIFDDDDNTGYHSDGRSRSPLRDDLATTSSESDTAMETEEGQKDKDEEKKLGLVLQELIQSTENIEDLESYRPSLHKSQEDITPQAKESIAIAKVRDTTTTTTVTTINVKEQVTVATPIIPEELATHDTSEVQDIIEAGETKEDPDFTLVTSENARKHNKPNKNG